MYKTNNSLSKKGTLKLKTCQISNMRKSLKIASRVFFYIFFYCQPKKWNLIKKLAASIAQQIKIDKKLWKEYCVCLVIIKRAPVEQSSEKAFVRTREYDWRQNKDNVGGATC